MTQQTGIRRELEAAPLGAAGASLRQAVDWRSNEWKRANRNVRCLQRRIVEAQQLRLLYRVLQRGRLKCLSRVRRKQQARFLGEGDGSNAIPLPGKWKRVNSNVCRLQRRIVQAQQQGKKRKVRALQFILTRSYSARCLAVRRVVENPGRRTPGVDGQNSTRRKRKRRPWKNSMQKITRRSLSSASTSPRRTGKAVAHSEFQRWMTAPDRRCICWPSTPSRKRPPIRTPMVFGKNGQWPMRSSNALFCSVARTLRNGF